MYTHTHTHTHTPHGLGVWGCHLCSGRLIKTNLKKSDSSFSQASCTGEPLWYLYSGCWSLVFQLSSLRAIVSKWGWRNGHGSSTQPWLYEGLLFPPSQSMLSVWGWNSSPHQAGPRSQSWPVTLLCFAGHSNWFGHRLLSLLERKSCITVLWLLRLKFSWFPKNLNPVGWRSRVFVNHCARQGWTGRKSQSWWRHVYLKSRCVWSISFWSFPLYNPIRKFFILCKPFCGSLVTCTCTL